YDSSRGNAAQDEYQKKLVHFYDQLRFGEYRVQLRPDGRVVQVSGLDKLLGEIGAEPQLIDFHAQALHDDTFAWFLQHALGVLPDRPSAEGAKWEAAAEAKVASFGALTGKTEYVLGKHGKVGDSNCRDVALKGRYALEVDAKWLGQALRGALKTTKLEGTLRFDHTAGKVRSSSVEVALGGDLYFGNNDKPALV